MSGIARPSKPRCVGCNKAKPLHRLFCVDCEKWFRNLSSHDFDERADTAGVPSDMCAVCGCFRDRHEPPYSGAVPASTGPSDSDERHACPCGESFATAAELADHQQRNRND